jgi:hypothetical protein
MLMAVAVLFSLVLVPLGILLFMSPGRPKPFLDDRGQPLAGSVSEKIHLNINGVAQGMFIQGKTEGNPVLLYLHGGMPDYFLTQRYPIGWTRSSSSSGGSSAARQALFGQSPLGHATLPRPDCESDPARSPGLLLLRRVCLHRLSHTTPQRLAGVAWRMVRVFQCR